MSAKRSKPAVRPRQAETRPVEPVEVGVTDAAARPSYWLIGLGAVWLIGFCIFFSCFDFPNNQWLTRRAVWLDLPDLISVSQIFSARWSNLGQRAEIFGPAAFVLASAWCCGQLLLRWLRPSVGRHSAEGTVFAFALGLTFLSLATLVVGLAGLLNRALFSALCAAPFLLETGLVLVKGRKGPITDQSPAEVRNAKSPWFWLLIAAMVPFVCVMCLGSMSPERDFDVLAYHFEGPKEYFEAGRVTFLPHNVYTNFPFFAEMLVLLGMVLRGDWYWGALVGKCVLFACAPLTAFTLYAAGRRYFSREAGLLAALVFLSTPWIDRITIIAYVEGALTFFLAASLLAALIAIERFRANLPATRDVLLVGLLAGTGMACKYTGLLQVVVPIGLAIVGGAWLAPRGTANRNSRVIKALVAFSLGVAITIGPWLLKNLYETGNPVYPLAYNLFGGRGWSPELNARFVPAHSPHKFGLGDLGQNVLDVIADNDWSSPLLFGLAPLTLLVRRIRELTLGLWLLVGYLFFAWWGFTHRIDRFWVPIIPVVALLAGVGATWTSARAWRWIAGLVITLMLWFNLALIAGDGTFFGTTMEAWEISGYNAWLSDLRQSRENAAYPYFSFMNRQLPTGAKVLDVGDGQVFNAQFPVVYNTVFNDSILKKWLAAPAPAPGVKEADLPLKPAKEILQKLHDEGITHVYVCWEWIRRYREPGNYGYTEFANPALFERLMKEGVLGEPVTFGVLSKHGMSSDAVSKLQARIGLGQALRSKNNQTIFVTDLVPSISDSDRQALKGWSSPLLTEAEDHDVVINAQIFPVR
ncbi:MAG TPA: glycosyltransferase family 39 protein [Planctomycetaceae bacterium]|nr:glycosyltransferase family 39 protein [Planctomycetaceae bacterium]